MKKIKLPTLLLAVAMVAGCEPPDEGSQAGSDTADTASRVIATEMHPDCWFNQHTLQQEVYHSPYWASRIDSGWTDSYGFRAYFRDIIKEIPFTIHVDFWGFFPQTGQEALVVIGIDSVDHSLYWAGINLADSVKEANVWQHFNIQIATPVEFVAPDHRLTIYVWAKQKQVIYIDDLRVRFRY